MPKAKLAQDNTWQEHWFYLTGTGEVFHFLEVAELICQNEGTQFFLLNDAQPIMLRIPEKPEYVVFPPGYALKTPVSRPGNSGIHFIF